MNEHLSGTARKTRWWLDSALARLAFGRSTGRPDGACSRSSAAALRRSLHDASAPVEDGPLQREFGDYELLEAIGQGGMGTVYRARQRNLDREVAIKLLSAGSRAPAVLVDNLRSEAHHAAVLQHPHIVTVHELGEYEGRLFYAMQLVRGRSLSQQLDAEGAMPPREAARLLRPVAEAVDYAHRLGVLHLDLKPGNILIDDRGAPLIADFGLARRLEQALQPQDSAGTPGYMAPEQARTGGPPLSPATDVWALGAVLYEMLTGGPPFHAADPLATVQQTLEREPPPLSLLANVPADLEAICLRCLEKDPHRRYADARALADDLGRYLEGHAVSVRPLNTAQRLARWARREPKFASATVLALLALLGGIIATTQQWQRAQHNAAAASERLWESRREAALRLELEGKGFDAMPRLLQNIQEEEENGRPLSAALDRRRVGMLAGQGAVLVDRMVIADANPMSVAISPDGSLLAVGLNDRSVRWYDTSTLHERGRISLAGRTSSDGQRRMPILLRFVDDHHLRVTQEWYVNLASPTDGDTWLVDLDVHAVVAPPSAFTDFADADFSRDGRHALLRNHRIQVQPWQVLPWRPLGPPLRVPLRATGDDYVPSLLLPDARHAAFLGIAMRTLLLYDLRDDASWSMHFPGDAGISAWNASHDGRWIALGDFEGRVFVLDVRARALRTLPTGRGREITWVDFSEDDGWIAAGSADGIAYAFDVASGDALTSLPMRQDFMLRRVGISHARRLLVTAGEGQVALWRLPLPGPRGLPAQRIGLAPARYGLAGPPYATDWSLSTGLLATAGVDGQVRLWRLPQSPLQTAHAARQVPEKISFDGRHLVDVSGNRLRICATGGRQAGAWLTLPQAPGYAELVDRGRTLLVTVGPQLRIYDARTLRLRAPPISLPQTPERLLASDDGNRLLLAFAAHDAKGYAQRLQLYDLRRGKALPDSTMLPGQSRLLAFSPDGGRLLSVGNADGGTTVLGGANLERIGEYPHDPFQPVVWASFARDGRLLMVKRALDERLGNDSVLWWDPHSDRSTSVAAREVSPLGVAATAWGPFIVGVIGDLSGPDAGPLRAVPRLAASEPTAVLATSPDGRLVAHGFRREVQLYDLASGAMVGPPLQMDTDAIDVVVGLAFAPDGNRLLARTLEGHWVVWPVAPETRPVRELRLSLARLWPVEEGQRQLHIPTAAEHVALRVGDPGPWPALEPATRAAVAAWTPSGNPIPARAASASPLLLDMTSSYTLSPDDVRNTFYSVQPTMRGYPIGLQRFGGVDYDVRGAREIGAVLSGPAWRQFTPRSSSISCLPVPSAPIAAIRPLLEISLRTPLPPGAVEALARLHYRDGGSVELPLRSGRELPGFAGGDRDVPYVFSVHGAMTVLGYPDFTLLSPRLANPHPARSVRCLDLSAAWSTAPLIVYAVTVEPVIPGAAFRTDKQDEGDRHVVSAPPETTR